jgi:hypothetical protein
MITEDYVGFETAKLLKEKGFDEYCLKNYWDSDKELHDWKWELSYNRNSGENRNTKDCAAPTQSLVLKWLRLCYDIVIDISPNLTLNDVCKGSFMSEIYQYGHIVPEGEFGCNVGDDYTYEQAVEAALKYTLENLI